mmetsp:Transcript_32824/g.50142  ORF Transcript_32824/g.50142 Transcript_32824/m.50142 type:complete len:91 (+) Transcript_32824:489-761(+)
MAINNAMNLRLEDSIVDKSGVDSSFQPEGGNLSMISKSFKLLSAVRKSIIGSAERGPSDETPKGRRSTEVELGDLRADRNEKKNRLVDEL